MPFFLDERAASCGTCLLACCLPYWKRKRPMEHLLASCRSKLAPLNGKPHFFFARCSLRSTAAGCDSRAGFPFRESAVSFQNVALRIPEVPLAFESVTPSSTARVFVSRRGALLFRKDASSFERSLRGFKESASPSSRRDLPFRARQSDFRPSSCPSQRTIHETKRALRSSWSAFALHRGSLGFAEGVSVS
jgi:hypothetical protein